MTKTTIWEFCKGNVDPETHKEIARIFEEACEVLGADEDDNE